MNTEDVIVDIRNGEIRKIIIVMGDIDDTFATEVHLTISDEGIVTDFVQTNNDTDALELVGTIDRTWGSLWDSEERVCVHRILDNPATPLK